MRKNRLLLLLASLLVLSIQHDAQAQQQKAKYRNPANDPVRTLPDYKKQRFADGLFNDGSYFTAIEYYSQLKLNQPRNPYLAYQLGEAYMFSRDYGPAAKNYGEAYAMAAKLYPEAKFKEARMLKMQGLYDSSIHAFEQFIADNPKTFKKLKKTAQIEIDGAKMGKNSVNDPQPVTMKNAGPNVNSAYTEASPYPLGDTALLFSTMNQNSVASSNGRKNQYFSRFMTAHKQYHVADVDSFQWPLPFNDGPFNDDRIHTGNGSYSPGGDRFYFTRCKEGDTMAVICKIYVSTFDTLRGTWKEGVIIGEGINEEGSNTHPFVAKVGKKEILFFSSNRKIQSRGKYDLWYSVIDPARGTYRRPQNCGKQVNTEGNDMTPYYDSRTNTLYFASDGQVSMGGFDIYSAQGGPSRYTNLQNMGYPINTSADELYYIKDPVGKPDAYVVSNRVGSIALKNPTCCDDIWRIQTEPKLQVLGKVLNSRTQKQINNVVVKIVDETGALRTYNSVDGAFQFNTARDHNYVITGDKPNYVSTRAQVSTEGIPRSAADQTVNVTIYLDSSSIGDFRVSNVYYPFNSAELTAASVASLDSLVAFMKDNPSLTVNIYSHTDSIGTAKYNQDLSLRRANAIRSYLVRNGVDGNRMMARARSFNDPAAPNSRRNGADNAAGRQFNRRTEFEIVKEDPTRRIIFQSKFPGTIDAQETNLRLQPMADDNEPADNDSKYGEPGSRDQNP